MSRRPKIIWTVVEEADFYSAFVEELKESKITFPVGPEHLREIMRAARTAMKVLKVERRRDVTSIDGIRGDLGQRLVTNNVFPRNYLDVLRRSPKQAGPAPVDPRDARVAELEAELAASRAQQAELQRMATEAQARIADLEDAPSPLELVEDFFARIIAKGLGMKEGWLKPAHRVEKPRREELPQHERDRRRNGGAPWPDGANGGKPKIAVLGGEADDFQRIQAALGARVELRYLDSAGKVTDAMKHWNANGGRLVVWSSVAGAAFDQALNAKGLTFSRFNGNVGALIEHLHGMARL